MNKIRIHHSLFLTREEVIEHLDDAILALKDKYESHDGSLNKLTINRVCTWWERLYKELEGE